MTQFVSIVSVPYSGTNFTRTILETAIDFDQTMEWSFIFNQSHLDRRALDHEDLAWTYGLIDGVNLLMQHVNTVSPKYAPRIAQTVAMFGPCIVPVRDPLASAISRWQRLAIDDTVTIDSYVAMVQHLWADNAEGIFEPIFFPVDVIGKWSIGGDRYNLLRELCFEIAGRTEIEIHYPRLEQLATDWRPENSRGVYPLKLAYNAGEADYISNKLPKMWAALQDAKDLLQPFCEVNGYDNLMWWRD